MKLPGRKALRVMRAGSKRPWGGSLSGVFEEQQGGWSRFPSGTHKKFGFLLVLYEELQINTIPGAATR